jgi:hypothetical protein
MMGFFSAPPFVLLDEVRGRELVAGVLRPPRAEGTGRAAVPGSPAEFAAALERARFAAIATFRADPTVGGATLGTETWVRTRGALPSIAFLAYWLAIAPFSAWIRRVLLGEARRRASHQAPWR